MSQEITPRDALTRLGASSAEAIAQVLDMFAPGAVQRGEVSVPEGANPFSNLPFPAIAISVSYVDGVTGANIFVMTPQGARALATAMGVPPPEAEGDATAVELTELELSAVAEAANQMMAAAASAIGVVIGQEIEISPPERRVLNDAKSALEAYGRSPHATSTTFLINGEQCRLLQLVPSAFVQRMVRAIDEASVEHTGAAASASLLGSRGVQSAVDHDENSASVGLQEALTDISLRVWAELGRTSLPLGKALALPLGAVVDLDRPADAPVDLFVNGVRFAEGHLIVTEDGEWAICLDEMGGRRLPGSAADAARMTHQQRKGALI